MKVRALVLTLAGALLAGAPASAWVPEKTPRRDLEARVRRALVLAPARGALPGVIVLRGGRPILALNPDRPFVPASLMKLATTTAALETLGANHRFVTRVLAPRRRAAVSTLWLVGGGDPTLATAAYRREHFLPKPDDPEPIPVFRSGSPTIEQLAARVRRAGIRSVGTLVVDDSLFDAARTAPGWLARYTRRDPDVGYIDALTVNQGFAGPRLKVLLRSPAVGAGEALAGALRARGVRVDGAVVRGRAPRAAIEVAHTLSPPLADIVFYVNRWSVNYPAELILKYLGARFGAGGTSAAGVEVVRGTLARLGIPLAGFRMADGSGLSRADRATPRTIAAILDHMRTREGPTGEAMRESLPVAGGPGTLFERPALASVRGNLRGKTGLLRGVRAMAGWVTGRDGVPLVYVAMFNRARSAPALTRPLDLIGLSLALFPLL